MGCPGATVCEGEGHVKVSEAPWKPRPTPPTTVIITPAVGAGVGGTVDAYVQMEELGQCCLWVPF